LVFVPYPAENLRGSEELVLDLHPHWWTITPSMLALALALVFGIVALAFDWADPVKVLAAIAVIATLIWFLWRFVQLRVTHFVLTSDRVIFRHGVLSKRGVEIPLDSINAIHFSQRVWERMLGLGDLRIDSASVLGVSEFENIRKPNRVQNEIYVQMEGNENRKFDRVSDGINAKFGAPQAPPPASTPSITDQIEKLGELRDKGVLSEEEFQAKKAELLQRM
jgi:membrane protein YdbS with pleckstrin-like domain